MATLFLGIYIVNWFLILTSRKCEHVTSIKVNDHRSFSHMFIVIISWIFQGLWKSKNNIIKIIYEFGKRSSFSVLWHQRQIDIEWIENEIFSTKHRCALDGGLSVLFWFFFVIYWFILPNSKFRLLFDHFITNQDVWHHP